MRRCIVHFGMHKTGSSSIQQSLFTGLSDPRFHYVSAGNPNLSGPVSIAFRSRPEQLSTVRRQGRTAAEVGAIRASVLKRLKRSVSSAALSQTLLVSAEGLCVLRTSELKAFHDFMSAWSGEFVAVGYVRAPKAYMESAFQERLKAGGSNFNLEGLYPKYRRRFASFEKVFGSGQVQFWSFDANSFPDGCVVKDYCRRLGIEMPASRIIRANEGLSMGAVKLLYAYRKLGSGYGIGAHAIPENTMLINRLAELQGPKMHFAGDIVAPILSRNIEDIAWMESRLGCRLHSDAPTSSDGRTVIRTETDLLDVDPIASRWLAEQLGRDYVDAWKEEVAAEQVAQWMHALRLKLAGESRLNRSSTPGRFSGRRHAPRLPSATGTAETSERRGKPIVVRLPKLVGNVIASHSNELKDVSEASAAELTRAVLNCVTSHITASATHEVTVPHLGRFRIKREKGEVVGIVFASEERST